MAPLLSEEESALDPYLILELGITANEKDISKAYRKKTLLYHPDKNPTPEAGTSLFFTYGQLGV
jgi:DnaJ family protein C protein 17